MNTAPVMTALFCTMIALAGCSSRADERGTASSSGAAAASRPAEQPAARPAPPPQAAAQPTPRSEADQSFREQQRK